MWIEILFFIITCFMYFLFYVDMKINNTDNIYLFNKILTRSNLFRETFLKSPFYFDGTHLNENIKKSLLEKKTKKKNSYTSYTKIYNPILLLEPNIRFQSSSEVNYINTYLPLETNHCSINYYIIKEGQCKITFIHPKFKENFYCNNKLDQNETKINYIKKHNQFKTMIFEKNSIIYVPNDWILFIENNKDIKNKCVIETIHYKTICNQIIGWIKKNLIKIYKK